MDEYETLQTSAQEMALHMAMCVNADFIRSWGMEEFLETLLDYCDDAMLVSFVAQMNRAQEILERDK